MLTEEGYHGQLDTRDECKKVTYPELTTDICSDSLADKECQSIRDQTRLLRVILDQSCELRGENRDLESLGQVDCDGWVQRPGNPRCLTPDSLWKLYYVSQI